MNILAMDTSGERLSIAFATPNAVHERDVRAGQRHSELILGEINAALEAARCGLQDVDGIAFGAGPGSFTGLRIACGVAQGLALSLRRPVVGISTLAALAECTADEAVVTCIDARMGEVYHAAYRRSSEGWLEVHAPGLYRPEDVPPLGDVLEVRGKWVGCGSGFGAHGTALRARLGPSLGEVWPDVHPCAAALARLARIEFEHGGGGEAHTAQPLYIRDKVALKTHERG